MLRLSHLHVAASWTASETCNRLEELRLKLAEKCESLQKRKQLLNNRLLIPDGQTEDQHLTVATSTTNKEPNKPTEIQDYEEKVPSLDLDQQQSSRSTTGITQDPCATDSSLWCKYTFKSKNLGEVNEI